MVPWCFICKCSKCSKLTQSICSIRTINICYLYKVWEKLHGFAVVPVGFAHRGEGWDGWMDGEGGGGAPMSTLLGAPKFLEMVLFKLHGKALNFCRSMFPCEIVFEGFSCKAPLCTLGLTGDNCWGSRVKLGVKVRENTSTLA